MGLSEISALGDGKFLVLERDNQGGPDAAIKKVYVIELGDFSMPGETVLEKTLVKDLLPTLMSFNGPVFEKVEGMAVDASGNVWLVNDNDGVDDNSGEQRLINLGAICPWKNQFCPWKNQAPRNVCDESDSSSSSVFEVLRSLLI